MKKRKKTKEGALYKRDKMSHMMIVIKFLENQRMCVDFIHFNMVCANDMYPISNMDI